MRFQFMNWVMFRQVYDPTTWIEKVNCEAWPKEAAIYDRPDIRLTLGGIWGDRFGRLKFD